MFYVVLLLIAVAGFAATVPPRTHHKYCVIGAGPAGLQIGYFLERAKRDYVVFERANQSASFYVKYPRHRRIISINKRFTGKTNAEFNLRHDWNSLISDNASLLVKHYSPDFFPHADDLLRYFNDYATHLNINVQYNTNIGNITKDGSTFGFPPSDDPETEGLFFMNDTNTGSVYTCQVLIVATGIWVPKRPSKFPGIEHLEYYDSMSLNQSEYEGQSVLILGRGNSAFETADHIGGHTALIHMLSRSRVRLSWSTHYVGDLRALNNQILDTYQLKSLDALLEADVEEMAIEPSDDGRLFIKPRSDMQEDEDLSEMGEGDDDDIDYDDEDAYERARHDENEVLSPDDGPPDDGPPDDFNYDNFAMREPYDRVVACLGFGFDWSPFRDDVKPQKGLGRKAKYPAIRGTYESTTVDSMYFAGTNTHSRDFRKSSGGFIHGFRYTARALHYLLEWRYERNPWPSRSVPYVDLLDFVLKRTNEMSGPYQMFGFLVDVILLPEDSNSAIYLEEVPIDVLAQFENNTGHSNQRYIVVNLQYGEDFSGPGNDVFREDRATGEPGDAHNSNFLHPVLFYYDAPLEKMASARLPKPVKIHHMVEDFLTLWNAPVSHILPLRRFFEDILGQDLRNYFADSCFMAALTHTNLPPKCADYMNGQGFVAGEELTKAAAHVGAQVLL